MAANFVRFGLVMVGNRSRYAWCLEWSVLGVEGDVEEPRVLLAFLKPGDCSLAVGISRIEGGVVDFHDIGRLPRVDEIRRVEEGRVGECAVKLIEAAGGRPILGTVAEVPLADADRVVAERLESAWQRGLAKR